MIGPPFLDEIGGLLRLDGGHHDRLGTGSDGPMLIVAKNGKRDRLKLARLRVWPFGLPLCPKDARERTLTLADVAAELFSLLVDQEGRGSEVGATEQEMVDPPIRFPAD